MTIKEILSEITEYISLSPIANNHYGKSRQWLYHKVNEDIINRVQYKLSDGEIDILISALESISNNISTATRNLEEFKGTREYLEVPEEDRKLMESCQERLRELKLKYQDEEVKSIIKDTYKSTTSEYVREMLDGWINVNAWHLSNLKDEPIKYRGDKIKEIVSSIIRTIEKKVEAESKKLKRKKKKDEDEDDCDNNEGLLNCFAVQDISSSITDKMYYQLNKLTPPKYMQEKINKIPSIIPCLGNIELIEIENLVYEKLSVITK